jgi:hypothetical protein
MDAFGGGQLPAQRAALRTIMLIVLGAVVLVGIGYGFLWLRRAKDEKSVQASVEARLRGQLEQAVAACGFEEKSKDCRVQAVEKVALESGLAELCTVLSGTERDSCVWTVARQEGNPTLCKQIESEADATSCADELWLKKARGEENPSLCKELSTNSLRASCERVVKSVTQSCTTCEVTRQAIATQNIELCSSLSDEAVTDCQVDVYDSDVDGDSLTMKEERTFGTDVFKSDTDGDGLTDNDEITLYKTDPTNPDTDGDSYLDGTEVAGGYNPLGAGMIGR